MFRKKPSCSKENLHFGQLFTLKFHWLEVVTSSVVLLINRRHMAAQWALNAVTVGLAAIIPL